jgi:MFS transporter, DHA1 family, tetracycline resistance protein
MSDPANRTPQPDASPSGHRSAMLIVFLVMFIDLLGFGIVLPLLPRFGKEYLAYLLPGGSESRYSGMVLGLMMASFSAMQFVFAPLWGRISDNKGRRPILLLGLTGSVLFYALLGVAFEMSSAQAALAVLLMFIARLGAGIAGATISTAQAVIADSTTPEKRKMGMAMIGAAFGIGFTFGPLIGFGALYAFPTHTGSLGFVAAGLSMVALLLAIRIMPETRRPGVSGAHRKVFDWQALEIALKIPTVGLLIALFFLATFGFAQFETTLSLLNKDNLKLGDRANFLIFAYVGFVLMLVQGLIYRRLARRIREETFITLGIVLMGLGVASLGGVTWLAGQDKAQRVQQIRDGEGEDWQQILDKDGEVDPDKIPGPEGNALLKLMLCTLGSLAVAVTGFAFLTPSVSALVSRRSDPAKQGQILGVNQSASAMARILGPAIGLPLYTLHPSHLLPYAVGACLILIMLPLMPRIRHGSDAVPVVSV